MGQNYEQLSLEERCTLSRLSHAGKTIRQIAATMDRAPSTIMRELKRNRGSQVGYQPAYANQQAKSRRWKGSRVLRDGDLQKKVLAWLTRGWSPAQVAGRLKKECKRQVISYESIYGSSIRRFGAPRTTAGGTTCLAPKASAAGADVKAAVRSITSRDGYPLINARPISISADSQVIGKET